MRCSIGSMSLDSSLLPTLNEVLPLCINIYARTRFVSRDDIMIY